MDFLTVIGPGKTKVLVIPLDLWAASAYQAKFYIR